MSTYSYYAVFKPFGYLSQFTPEQEGDLTLADLCKDIPKDVFPVGRLDKDSEGLLLLTNDKRVNHYLLNPVFQHQRVYCVQVEGAPSDLALEMLQAGPAIKVNKSRYKTLPCHAEVLHDAPDFPERVPPIRVRKSIPDTWIALTLSEGKNRQVRRMCAAVGHPVLRLLRMRIGELDLGDMVLGECRELAQQDFLTKLSLPFS